MCNWFLGVFWVYSAFSVSNSSDVRESYTEKATKAWHRQGIQQNTEQIQPTDRPSIGTIHEPGTGNDRKSESVIGDCIPVDEVSYLHSVTRVWTGYSSRGRVYAQNHVKNKAWKGTYKRVKGRSHPVEKRKAIHPQKPHATSQGLGTRLGTRLGKSCSW